MKYTQKYLNKIYINPEQNFTEIINLSIYFDNINELDFGTDAVAAIESLEPIKRLKLLIEDLKYRKKEDFSNYGYQCIWWAILNSKSNDIYSYLSLNMSNEIKELFIYFLENELDKDDEPYFIITNLLNSWLLILKML